MRQSLATGAVLAEIRPAAHSVGHGLAWSAGSIPLLAFGLDQGGNHCDDGSSSSSDSIPVCIVHPDSPQVSSRTKQAINA